MTLRDVAREVLSAGPISHGELQKALAMDSSNRNSICSTIRRMVEDGEIISDKIFRSPTYSLNKNWRKPDLSSNEIFNHCRRLSRIRRDIDIPLRRVRS